MNLYLRQSRIATTPDRIANRGRLRHGKVPDFGSNVAAGVGSKSESRLVARTVVYRGFAGFNCSSKGSDFTCCIALAFAIGAGPFPYEKTDGALGIGVVAWC